MRYITFIFALAILLSFASAQQVYQVDKDADIRVICDYNGFCGSSSECNLTVVYPNNTILLDNVLMENNNAYHNYTVTATQHDVTGVYEAFGQCTDTGVSQVFSFDYEVTGIGYQVETPDVLLYIIYLIGFIAIFLLTLYGAIVIPYTNKMDQYGQVIGINYMKYVKVLCIMNIYIMLLFFSGTMRSIFEFFLLYDNVSGYFNFMYWILLSGVYPIIVLTGLIIIFLIIEDKEANKLMDNMLRGNI